MQYNLNKTCLQKMHVSSRKADEGGAGKEDRKKGEE